jgi:hypothetical protein
MSIIATTAATPLSTFREECAAANVGRDPYRHTRFERTGFAFAASVARHKPTNLTPDQWLATLWALWEGPMGRYDPPHVRLWLETNVPECMTLVPEQYRVSFVEGFIEAVLFEEIDVFEPLGTSLEAMRSLAAD